MTDKKTLVILSGAGVSAESGLGTFRDSGGLWEKYAIEDVATPEAWKKNPALVTSFYNMRRKQAYEAQPNLAHQTIAELEDFFNVVVITQNIDTLHEKAGSTNVLHLHGRIDQVKSSGPNAEKAYYEQPNWEVKLTDLCPEGYPLRPHVVWFGEAVPMLEEAARIVEKADVFVVIGTSLNVYPAAGLVDLVKPNTPCFIVDPLDVPVGSNFTAIRAVASEGCLLLKKELLDLT
jgi:NAD-dependent deacetylase